MQQPKGGKKTKKYIPKGWRQEKALSVLFEQSAWEEGVTHAMKGEGRPVFSLLGNLEGGGEVGAKKKYSKERGANECQKREENKPCLSCLETLCVCCVKRWRR